ncbi:HAD family phosphatase [Parasalinivibrio latis]|uniref:HAD family hydrolase n=1 Tax=Parasalinivibrio latis TaxID=2952610 RepID=UPI0030DFA764
MDGFTKNKQKDTGVLRKQDIRFEAVLWDMDGTLADSEPLHEKAMRNVLAGLGITPSVDDFNNVIGTEGPVTFRYFSDKYKLSIGYEEYREQNYRYYCQHSNTINPLFGCEVYLALEELGIPQAIVSNSDRMLVQATMRAIGIEKPGLTVVTRNDVLLGKPDPEGYLRAAHLLGTKPRNTAVIEDSHVGAQAGIDAGMTVFGVPLEENRHRFDSSTQLANGKESLMAYLIKQQ